jgi:hypothetical protein
MDAIFYIFAVIVAGFAILASIAIWAPRAAWIRMTAVAIAIVMMPLCYTALAGLLAKPKPNQLVWFERGVEEAEILGASFSEGKAIYLWLRLKGMIEPRYYVLPWDQKTAQDLEDELEAAAKKQGRLKVIKPFTNDKFAQKGGLNIKIIPPPSLPMKPPRFPARVFNPRSTDI